MESHFCKADSITEVMLFSYKLYNILGLTKCCQDIHDVTRGGLNHLVA